MCLQNLVYSVFFLSLWQSKKGKRQSYLDDFSKQDVSWLHNGETVRPRLKPEPVLNFYFTDWLQFSLLFTWQNEGFFLSRSSSFFHVRRVLRTFCHCDTFFQYVDIDIWNFWRILVEWQYYISQFPSLVKRHFRLYDPLLENLLFFLLFLCCNAF